MPRLSLIVDLMFIVMLRSLRKFISFGEWQSRLILRLFFRLQNDKIKDSVSAVRECLLDDI